MGYLTSDDREKLQKLAEEGNEDALFFSGWQKIQQNRNYYRAWKILSESGDEASIQRRSDEKDRLKRSYNRKMALIEEGVCNGDLDAVEKRKMLRSQVAKRQRDCRASKKADKLAYEQQQIELPIRGVIEAAEVPQEAPNTRSASEYEREPSETCSECERDDDELLPTAIDAKLIKTENDEDDDVVESDAVAVVKLKNMAPWRNRKEQSAPEPRTHNRTEQEPSKPQTQEKRKRATPKPTMKDKEYELSMIKLDAEIREATLVAKKAKLELSRLQSRGN